MLWPLYDLNFVLAGRHQGVKRSMMVLTLRQDSGNPKVGSQENIFKKSVNFIKVKEWKKT